MEEDPSKNFGVEFVGWRPSWGGASWKKKSLDLYQCQPSCAPFTEILFEPGQEYCFLLAAQLSDANFFT